MTDKAEGQQLVDAIVNYITTTDWVSFVELAGLVESYGVPTKGTYQMEAFPNGIIWAGMSKEFCALVEAIRKDRRVTIDGGSELSYLADGGALALPIAKSKPRDLAKGYAKPRWIVSFLRPAEKVRP
jgi:hypothetical protein